MRKIHSFAVEGIMSNKTYCGMPVTDKTVFAIRSAYVNCKRCNNKSRKGVITMTSNTTGSVAIIDSSLQIYT
jgi:hypothetical protein